MTTQRANIGVFVDTLDQDYQQQIVLGIDAEARSLELDVTCFIGGQLAAPDAAQTQLNAAYELCVAENIQALIVLSGTLTGMFVGRFVGLWRQYQAAPSEDLSAAA